MRDALPSLALRLCAAVLALGSLLALGCGGRKGAKAPGGASPTPKPTPSPIPVAGEVSGPTVYFPDAQGRRKLELTGGKFALPAGKSQITLSGTRAVVYEEGKPALTVEAREIEVTWKDQRLVARGGVSARSADGRAVRCDTLSWTVGSRLAESLKQKEKDWPTELGIVTGSGRVALTTTGGFALYGSRVSADTRLGAFRIEP